MLKLVKGDLILMAEEGHFDILVHGCNCQNVMGSGIAKSLRERYPGVYEADCIATETWKVPLDKLGNFSYYSTASLIKPDHNFTIVSAYTQLDYLPRGIDHFEYESFNLILKKLKIFGNVRFGFPYIGMGLAGGDSSKIIPMLEEFGKDMDATLVEFN